MGCEVFQLDRFFAQLDQSNKFDFPGQFLLGKSITVNFSWVNFSRVDLFRFPWVLPYRGAGRGRRTPIQVALQNFQDSGGL
jgi:hypothetical protein